MSMREMTGEEILAALDECRGNVEALNAAKDAVRRLCIEQENDVCCPNCHKAGNENYSGKNLGWQYSDYCRWCGQRLSWRPGSRRDGK